MRVQRCLASASITGPIAVAGSAGSPDDEFARRACNLSIMRSATSSAGTTIAAPRQRWPASGTPRSRDRRRPCSGSGWHRRHRIDATGSPRSRHDRSILGGERRLIVRATFRRARRQRRRHRGATSNAPIRPSPPPDAARTPARRLRATSLMASAQSGSVGPVRNDRVAGHQGCRDLTRKSPAENSTARSRRRSHGPRRRRCCSRPLVPGIALPSPNN